MKFWFKYVPLSLLIALSSCGNPSTPHSQNTNSGAVISTSANHLTNPPQAVRGEWVKVILPHPVSATTTATVTVGGKPAFTLATPMGKKKVKFKIPTAAQAGQQSVVVQINGNTFHYRTEVWGKVKRSEVIVRVSQGITPKAFQTHVEGLALGLSLIDFIPLNGIGPCADSLARVSVPPKLSSSIGFVVAQLQAEKKGIEYWPDPQSIGDLDPAPVVHKAAKQVGAYAAHTRGFQGQGITIAVLDTGVNQHPILKDRVLPGYDFADNDKDPSDQFDDPTLPHKNDGHGTAIAILAAGKKLGVAPKAKILPIRIADENGEILVSNAIRGVCYALNQTNPKKLVFNLSFGGDTPTQGLKGVLEHALNQKALVAAAAGNQGENAPVHYPAAYNLPGLVAVGALEKNGNTWKPANFSTHGLYVDIAAPGMNVLSGLPQNNQYDFYTGTSFSTGLVAGALALWREAYPKKSSQSIEKALKNTAKPIVSASQTEVGSGMLDLTISPKKPIILHPYIKKSD